MRQYQYRMKCRKAPNQNWSSWGDCSLGSAYHYLEDTKNESNIWTYEVRERLFQLQKSLMKILV